ncbi:hypothetical protein COW99_01380 [Candidatus Roizmanbacteria bacterium CG22_combo_CG10-13_8_21_14_all_38_20]|uniref:Fibronectin type-III domain-containing protein n=1 Tax=Candidatus Roizmanbacteria bacterium CG22_combo_CG10-13_8_21_14_all_38_20 TaxID=1974862 RepID=A0A2H0BW00_9BACT|nr:hypothetical protein [Candidatus Microgenomates bacterium]PIP61857.1 MAG: hypothetical protein COW99_01380 [Candidatus Roizmanbacteria bacterium CG22_combo_CG10-13_8_21_14_all_38_20]
MSANQTVKRIVQFASLVILVSLIYVEVTSAYLSETVTTTGNKIMSGCWDKPTAPELTTPANSHTANTQTITFDWKDSSSSCETAILEYKVSIYLDEELTSEYYSSDYSTDLTHTKELANGEYWWTVSVQDQYQNTKISQSRSLTVDQSQIIINNWITTGDVQFQDDVILIGRQTYTNDAGNYLWENRLMQSISPGAKTLSFDYKFTTVDDVFSDIPGFRVLVNGNIILSVNASGSDIDWTTYTWDLSSYGQTKNIDVEFQAGNTGDKINQSWVTLKNISTSIISTTPSTPDTPLETTYEESIGYQNIIINELLLREPASRSDLELRNTTNTEIDLTGIKLTKFDGSLEIDMDITLSESLVAYGYLVIDIDELDENHLQIRLYNSNNDLIDVAGDGGPTFAGLSVDGEYYSMQRTIIVGEGTSALNWFTALLNDSSPHHTLGEKNY